MLDAAQWVTDTSVYTHLSRAGHIQILESLAPGGVLLVPDDVDVEIRAAQILHQNVIMPGSNSWTRVATLSEREVELQLSVKASLGGGPTEHLGECAVIACAQHRGLVALLDERRAIVQATARNVQSHDTLWLVVEAYATIFDYDRTRAEQVIDDLIATGMYLPIASGQSLFAWAYEQGYLPRP
ncbi:hypothetical protein Back2_06530 [Nocardioides baekrokdamisoli]|uniref:DUF3368 domain-containing protein n=1 Tax=Nocardioides baekrokdamisoli TaxID=1804624 RepID=A0A3G9IDD5_9ACTN|nr:hypothetical protein Back2_06530 [Nocardioides baekrokdamisoli]